MFDGTGMRIFEVSSDGIKILRLLARVNSRRPRGVALFVSFTWSEIEPVKTLQLPKVSLLCIRSLARVHQVDVPPFLLHFLV